MSEDESGLKESGGIMAVKVNVFPKAKKFNKKIKKLTPLNQSMAVSYLDELELQAEFFIRDLNAQEELKKCLSKV
jgi:hypothetical protein